MLEKQGQRSVWVVVRKKGAIGLKKVTQLTLGNRFYGAEVI